MEGYKPTRAMMARFHVEGGRLRARLPKRMTWKRALEYSIAKWVYIQQHLEKYGGPLDEGAETTCACCRRADYSCRGCPIAQAGGPHCINTPYELCIDVSDEDNRDGAIKAAKQEIEFLQRLYHKLYESGQEDE